MSHGLVDLLAGLALSRLFSPTSYFPSPFLRHDTAGLTSSYCVTPSSPGFFQKVDLERTCLRDTAMRHYNNISGMKQTCLYHHASSINIILSISCHSIRFSWSDLFSSNFPDTFKGHARGGLGTTISHIGF